MYKCMNTIMGICATQGFGIKTTNLMEADTFVELQKE